ELALQHLAGAGARQLRADVDVLRGLHAAEAAAAEIAERVEIDGGAGGRLDDGGDRLAPLLVRDAEHRAFAHSGEGEDAALDLRRVDVEPAADDHVLLAVDDVDEAVLVLEAHVAGELVATVAGRRRRLGVLVVAGHDAGAVDRDLAGLAAGDGPTFVV